MSSPEIQLKKVDIGGLVIDVIATKGDGNWYLQRKTFEEKVSPLYEFIAQEQFVNFIDIGANYGFISMLARRAAPTLKILSIEADPRLARLIDANFQANGLEPPTVVNCVAGHLDDQTVGFSLNPTSTLDNRVRMSQWTQVQVPMTTVGKLLLGHSVSGKTFFKIDTQGFEFHILQGLESWLDGRDDWLLKMEFAPQWLESQGTGALELLGYLHARYEIAEYLERIPFGVPDTQALFTYPLKAGQLDRFLQYVISLNKNGQGWVDLIVRPRHRARLTSSCSMRILVTCPPMLGMFSEFVEPARAAGFELVAAKVTQTLSQDELVALLPEYDGWIIGDDPATRRVFEAGKAGRLKAAVKWGIGVDNVDFAACKDLGIPISNTPQMFGAEVADVALAYVIGLARQLFAIDRGVREGGWPKPAGVSLADKKVALVGYGDIGRALARRLLACDMEVVAYDPGVAGDGALPGVQRAIWPDRIEEADFVAFTCSLNERNRHMLNADVLSRCKQGVFVVNVARGPLIDEPALVEALQTGHVRAAALDVFEEEPLPVASPLRAMPQCVFGSHNGSNSQDAVRRASHEAMSRLFGFLRA